MDRRMLDLGGEQARRVLLAKVNQNRMAIEGDNDNNQAYNAEEAKVQEFGDTGQGNRLTDAKKLA